MVAFVVHIFVQISVKIGRVSTAILLAYVGHPRNFSSSGAYLKMMGLNLKEYSSGTKQSGLHITKRGHGKPRMHLCLATLRCLMSDEVFKACFEKHTPVTTSGRRKGSVSTIIAMMRKLVRGLWHCANYDVAFNSEQLFDTRR
ncbi:MAG: IS110 family transposase [Deltaproteobacteria bacterium]|nr:IS110 family transposase [Deltaproteobacteria bacterium]